MTPAEQDAMPRHQAYWQDLLAEGRVVVYGPVADPEGIWGMGVLRAEGRARSSRSETAIRHSVRRQHL